mgnify:CR=1 FL=1
MQSLNHLMRKDGVTIVSVIHQVRMDIVSIEFSLLVLDLTHETHYLFVSLANSFLICLIH